ncbi:uncharacterized protein TM35_000043730 [Trypanosoma theileri]|uniref:Uncharacterized protein n=1 Tax=Trypanosoma theileri TaxID=67003 RepID=A0A1X0P6H1_9TRYP|nr:uncharacterized protein TM35_000043730 [Trypanosoma theileri]ORC92159.1 hypothetical protein TM35_000043730 [Trypanosoma theileri]
MESQSQQEKQQRGVSPLIRWSAVANDRQYTSPHKHSISSQKNNTSSLLSGYPPADTDGKVVESCAATLSASQIQEVMWCNLWSAHHPHYHHQDQQPTLLLSSSPTKIKPTTTTTPSNKIIWEICKSPNAETILVHEQVESAAASVPSIECSNNNSSNNNNNNNKQQRPGVHAKIPLLNFVTKYRRRVEGYAAQNTRDLGFLSSSTQSCERIGESHSEHYQHPHHYSSSSFSRSLAESMPLHVKCEPQCEEESMMGRKYSQSAGGSLDTTQHIQHPTSRRPLSAVDPPISIRRGIQTTPAQCELRSKFSSISPEQILDVSGLCDQSIKRPVSLRRICFESSSDSAESSIDSE